MHLKQLTLKIFWSPATVQNLAAVASHSCTATAFAAIPLKSSGITGRGTKALSALFFALIFHLPLFAQDSSMVAGDSAAIVVVGDTTPGAPPDTYLTAVLTSEQRNRRIKIVAIANVAGYGAAMVGLYQAWYKDYPQGKFHVFNDAREWKQMDKLGHVYSSYAESKASMELWRWTGISRKKRIWLGGMSGAMYQTAIEVLDGFSTEWGWSWADFAANIAGSGLLVSQELAWDEQRIQMKWSFNRKRYTDPQLTQRSDQLFGSGAAERFLKDYNGQTYWLSTTLKPFFPSSRLPNWLQLSVGTGVEGLFGGYDNIGTDKDGNVTFLRPDIKRYRQWYLAPDIDLTKIKTNRKGIKLALQLLNVFKFPTPSLELSNGKMSWNWLHF